MMREESEMMSDADTPQSSPRVSTISHLKPADSRAVLDLIAGSAGLLFVNGQTTERIAAAVEQLADRMGIRASVFPHWDELTVRIEDDSGLRCKIIAASPTGVDMNKVVATMRVVDRVCDGDMDAAAARSALEAISHLPFVSTARFSLMAAAGAAALGVIFGAAHLLSVVVIALSA